MTATLEKPVSLDLARLAKLSMVEIDELMCQAHMGVWAEKKRGFTNAPFHWEWYDLAMKRSRLCVVAPREHAKSEVFTVNQVVWRCTYQPGIWVYVFAQTSDQANKLLERIRVAMAETALDLLEGAHAGNMGTVTFANWSRVDVAGAGKSVRGAHPDLVIGDDVLEEGNSMTAHQRRAMARWWLGTVGGMSHPGTTRRLGYSADSPKVYMPPTRVHLVGTPFHQQDLLMNMAENPLYTFRRYAAEYEPDMLLEGHAVEVG